MVRVEDEAKKSQYQQHHSGGRRRESQYQQHHSGGRRRESLVELIAD